MTDLIFILKTPRPPRPNEHASGRPHDVLLCSGSGVGMSAHSSSSSKSKKRKRTVSIADGGNGSGVGESRRPDRWTPPPPNPGAGPATTAAQGTPCPAKQKKRKRTGKIGRCHGGGQRCCVACGGDGGSEPRARCSKCDAEYHPGCLDPPRAYAPKGVWMCGLCSNDSYHGRDRGSPPLGNAAARATRKKNQPQRERKPQHKPQHQHQQHQHQQHQQHQQEQQDQQQQDQQQEAAAGARSRFADVASSAFARLSSLSDGRGGSVGSRETTTAVEQRAPGVAGPAATATVEAATNRLASPPAGQSREVQDAAQMADRVLVWALKSVGGSGEEGRTTQSRSGDGSSKGGSSGPGVCLDPTEGGDGRESRTLSSSSSSAAAAAAAGRRGERRKRGVLNRSESEGSLESVEGGDSDGFSPPLWQEETEAQEDVEMIDAFDNDGGGGGGGGDGGGDGSDDDEDDDDVNDLGSVYGDDSIRLGDATGSDARPKEAEAAKARQERESRSGDVDVSESNAGGATSDGEKARNGRGSDSGSGTFAAANGGAESSAAVVAPESESDSGSDSDSDSEEGGEETRKRKRRSLWDRDENTRFLQVQQYLRA